MKFKGTEMVAMRDGMRLATDVYVPEGEGPFPTIVIRTPYDRCSARAQKKMGVYTSSGFAVVIQDVRGTGGSPTEEPFYPWLYESKDGPDALRWVEEQPFCNGRIGTHGGSYLCKDQWLAAPDAPESLQCMVTYAGPPSLSTGGWHGGAWHGGAPLTGLFLMYALLMQEAIDFSLGWMAGWTAAHKRFWDLPLCDADLVDGKHNQYFQDLIRKPPMDPHWQSFNVLAEPATIRIPVLQLDGWFDMYPADSLRGWEILRREAGTRSAREHAKVLIGAWAHDRESLPRCRDLDFGPNNIYDLYYHEVRWFRRWLMDEENGADTDPPLRLFTMGINTWQDFADWPAPNAELRPLYLHSRGSANTRQGDGVLDWEKPVEGEAVDCFRYDPLDPVPTTGGNHSLDYSWIFAGPADQSAVEERPDVLVYTTEPLTQALEIAGPVNMRLHAASSAPDTDFTAKLVDVHPDGRAFCMSEGILRASCRELTASASLIKPGEIYEYVIPMVDLSHVFLPGHRIRVEVSSSNFPKYPRNLNTGQDNFTTAEVVTARQTVFHDPERPSALLIWVR